MDIFANLVNQTFAANFRSAAEPYCALTQNNNQFLRIFLLRDNYPGTWPFTYDLASGNSAYNCIVSLRDLTAGAVTLASSAVLDPVPNGFSGILNTNTPEITAFLAGVPERPAAFCVDLADGSGNKTSPFRQSLVLRATDAESMAAIPATAGIIYNPAITGLTGGGATNLDGQTTATRALGTVWVVIRTIAGERVMSEWEKIAGVAATDLDAGIIQPLDFNALTNACNLVRVSGL